MNHRRFALSRWEGEMWSYVRVVRNKGYMWTRRLEHASRYTTRTGARQARWRLGLGTDEADIFDTERVRDV